jgi:hypothetical protein
VIAEYLLRKCQQPKISLGSESVVVDHGIVDDDVVASAFLHEDAELGRAGPARLLLVVGNQESDSIRWFDTARAPYLPNGSEGAKLYGRDPRFWIDEDSMHDTGALTWTGEELQLASPACLMLAELSRAWGTSAAPKLVRPRQDDQVNKGIAHNSDLLEVLSRGWLSYRSGAEENLRKSSKTNTSRKYRYPRDVMDQ